MKKIIRIIFLSIIIVFAVGQAANCQNSIKPENSSAHINTYIEIRDTFLFNDENLLYMLILPAKYSTSSAKWPLLLFLHGGSGRGENLDLVKNYGPPVYAEQQQDFPFVVLAPQCPAGKNWTNTNTLASLLDTIIARYKIDADRVYLTGMSMGGYGAWNLAAAHPEYFAAVAPIAAYETEPDKWAKYLIQIPIWVIHGDKDDLAPLEVDVKMVDALHALGASPRFTILEGRDHYITDIYLNNDVYDWLLTFAKKH
ncbi:MAG TPA: alpha/beta fold hydrolase [Ignavibacteriales bacterium]|nr:alpha/beta fold hydrolase [Ignavibacteriales bacterium]